MGDALPRWRRRLSLPAPGFRSARRVGLWLDAIARHSPGLRRFLCPGVWDRGAEAPAVGSAAPWLWYRAGRSLLSTLVNLCGLREGLWMQRVLTAAKVLGVLLIIAVGLLGRDAWRDAAART